MEENKLISIKKVLQKPIKIGNSRYFRIQASKFQEGFIDMDSEYEVYAVKKE